MRAPNFPGPVEHRTHTHKKQAFIKNMGVGMGNRPINRQGGTNSNANHHKSDLVNLTVTKHTTEIILNHRIKNRKHRHHAANCDQNLGSWK